MTRQQMITLTFFCHICPREATRSAPTREGAEQALLDAGWTRGRRIGVEYCPDHEENSPRQATSS